MNRQRDRDARAQGRFQRAVQTTVEHFANAFRGSITTDMGRRLHVFKERDEQEIADRTSEVAGVNIGCAIHFQLQ